VFLGFFPNIRHNDLQLRIGIVHPAPARILDRRPLRPWQPPVKLSVTTHPESDAPAKNREKKATSDKKAIAADLTISAGGGDMASR